MAPPDTRTFFQKTYDTVTNFANNLYTGADTLVGGILPGGQDITQGYIADIGRSIGLPISTGIPGGVASTIDTPSIQPVLESDNLSLEEVFAQPLDAGVSTGTMGLGDVFSAPLDGGTMGLEAAFGGGGGFVPPGITSEASMVEYGIGDGWVPNATYEQVSSGGGGGSGITRVTELPNNNYAVYVENYDTGKIESFVQKGTDGRQGITDYYSNSTITENNQTISSDRLYGMDISAIIGASVVDPNSTLKKSTQPVTVDQFYGKAPLPGMERIDTLNDAQLLTEIDIQEPGIPGGGSSDPFEKRVLDTINVIENNVSSDELPSNPYIQAIKDGKSIEDLFGIKIGGAEEEIVVNDLNTTLPASDNNSSLADAFASGGLADGGNNQTGLYSTPTQRYLEDENVFDTKADDFMSERNRNPQYKEIFGKPADEAIADMVSLGISKETATKIINKRDESTGNKQPMQFTNPSTATNNINPDGNQTATNNITIPEMDKISGVDNTQGSLNTNTNSDGSRENPMNTPGNPITQENSNEGIADGYSVNEATGIITQTNPDGSQTEIVSNEYQLNPRSDEIGPSIEAFHDYMETQAFYEDLKRRPNEGGDSSSLVLYDIVSEPMLDDLRDKYVELGKEAGLKQDQIDKLKGAGTWDNLKQTANDAFDFNAPGTLTGVAKIVGKGWNLLTGKSLKKIDEARKTHNINMQEQKAIRPQLEKKMEELKALGVEIDSLEELNISGYGLQVAIQDAINSTDDFDTKLDLAEALTELKGADILGLDVELTDEDFSLTLTREEDERYNNTYESDGLGDTSSPASYYSGKLADYENPFNPSDDPFKQPTLAEGGNQEGWDISKDTTRGPESWGVMNEDGRAVAKWNPFAKESVQEEVAKDIVNPNRSVSDGYSSPTMATIDRNIRPTLDRVGDFIEYPFEAAGLGMYNTIGRLPLVGGAGKSIGNALARTGQGIDRAIDTNLPDALFGLKTGDDGDDGSKMSKEEMDEILRITERNGISPLTELMRDKYLYGGTGNDSYSGGYAGGSPYLNSVSNGSMSIYGGTNAPGIASTGVPGGIGGSSNADNSGGKLDGLGSMAAGFDLSTSEGQEKFADLYGEDRLMDELSKRGIFDRRSSDPEDEALAKRDVYAGSEIADYTIKNLDEKPKPNIGQEIAEGIKNAQIEEKGIFA